MKKNCLIVALDVEDFAAARRVIGQLGSSVSFYKVGLRLFIKEGPAIVGWLKKKGFKVFLDLKLYDIPNTVAQAVESAVSLGVDLLTLHASGGSEMIKQAVGSARLSARRLKKKKPLIFAVTVLTSCENLGPLGISEKIPDHIVRLAKLSSQAGVDGVVCSPQEIRLLRNQFGTSLKILTPGIRWNEEVSHTSDDQKRTATPAQALCDGADYLVVGRPILLASSPREVVREILMVTT